jgi:hypothetical protein
MQTNEYNDQRSMYGIQDTKTIKAQWATWATSKWDIMMKLQERIESGIKQLTSRQ